jgi:alkylation response protein AidB-like acyl-CoA dehydrogenase
MYVGGRNADGGIGAIEPRRAGPVTRYEPEHEEFRASVRRFVDEFIVPRANEFRAAKAISRDLWKRAGDLGYLGFMMPEKYGGSGVEDFRFNAILNQELARIGFGFASSLGINIDVVSPYLRDLTSDSQRERWLPAFCAGDLITAIALTEPDAGSDLASVTTRAVPDGDGWMISGAKTYITNGSICDLLLVLARTGQPGAKGLSLFAVDPTAQGVSRDRKLDKVGQHEADTAEIFLDAVRVGPSELIGRENAAFGYLMRNLAQERLSCAISAHAAAERAFEVGLDYARLRTAFGKPVGSHQHNKFALASARTELDLTATWLDRCIDEHVTGSLDAAAAAKSKYWATEMQWRVTDLSMQLFGGMGYMTESEMARLWLDARVTRVFAGTSEIMLEVIGRSLGL